MQNVVAKIVSHPLVAITTAGIWGLLEFAALTRLRLERKQPRV